MKNIKLKIEFIKYLIKIAINDLKYSYNSFKFKTIKDNMNNSKFKYSESNNIKQTLILKNQESDIVAIQEYNKIRENTNDFFHISTDEDKLKILVKNEQVN